MERQTADVQNGIPDTPLLPGILCAFCVRFLCVRLLNTFVMFYVFRNQIQFLFI